ncbi:MAG: hypothetical protein AB1505_03660 [Candidatus Latescibacterota bacterium]
MWRQVSRSHTGSDGIFVQAEWHTFAYEIARRYAAAEHEDLDQGQLEARLKQLVHSYVNADYPVADGTDLNGLYYQYLLYVNPGFDPGNPLQRQVFDTWRAHYVQRLVDTIYDPVQPVLRSHYDDRWGLTLYSRLVFIVYLNSEESALEPPVADIGGRTFLVDEAGGRHAPSGTAGPYPYDSDRPAQEVLHGETVYRVFYPIRQTGRKEPILTPQSRFVELEIQGLGDEPTRRLHWDLPFAYPELPARRLPGPGASPSPDTAGAPSARSR